ncbi:hypothetical protein DWV84_19855 [Blautia sp. AF13-16]|uniref:hypothetical protein n=1 Tax=Blautia sp. AF13-16 TaxID=2292195 RepID=UPI000E4BA030|nr:hypothetical protein [Blautia sp. AF13-16]RHS12405.1 hypothetical protein DWV84_19855 [Blautia sp. AF13-16]
MAGYRRFVAYVYEYPDGKKGNGKGFIKVEARDGKCRMNYRIQGIYGKEEAPCKIYGFVRKSDGCEGIYLGECDLAGDTVQFQTEVPDQGLGGTAYGLNDLSGLVMLTGDGIMYGTGWDDRPVRLEEIRLPRMQEDRSRNADRAPETNNNMQKEELETGPEAVQDELPEGVAAAEALMEAEEPVTLDDEEGSLPLAEHSEETVNLFSGESPDDNLEEMDYRTDTTVEVETDSTDAGRAERGNTMEGNRAEAGNVMEGNRAEAGNAMERNRAETGNAMEGNRADGNNAMGGNRTERENAMEADWEAGNNAVGGNRAERENAIEADWEAGNNAVDGNRAGRNNSMDDTPWQGRYPSNTFRQGGMNTPDRNREERSNSSNAGHRDWGYPPVIGRDNETSAPDRRMEENRSNESSETEERRQAMPSRTEGDPYMPPRINERGTYFPQHYEEDEPETGQEERSEQRMEPVAPSRTENTVQPVMEPSRSDMGQNRNTAIPNMGQNRNTAVPNMGQNRNTAVPNMDQDRNAAMPDMNQNRNAAVPNMGQNRNTTMPDMNQNRNTTMPDMNQNRNTTMPDMNQNRNAAVPNMGQNRNTTMPDMNQNRNTAMPDTDRNPDTTAPDMERPPYTEEELYRETIDHEIFGRDQYPDSEMRIEASGSTDAAEQSTWNPAGDREEDAVNLLEELDQDEDAIRNMRQMEKEVTEKKVQSPEEGELHGQSAQAARQPAVFAPFSDGEIVDCRQITPAELRILARRDRGLMNNNFLRHGYYRYHYLLLGRRRDDGRYILGVPGVYDRQECLMAGMFGFPNFKAAKTQGKAAMPRFGYWYRLIDTPDINRRNRS